VRYEPDRFSTLGERVVPEKNCGTERGAEWLLTKVRGIGPHASEWAAAMLRARGIAGGRVLQGMLALDKRYATDDIERACETMLSYGAFHLIRKSHHWASLPKMASYTKPRGSLRSALAGSTAAWIHYRLACCGESHGQTLTHLIFVHSDNCQWRYKGIAAGGIHHRSPMSGNKLF
jgi:hypothetical protein